MRPHCFIGLLFLFSELSRPHAGVTVTECGHIVLLGSFFFSPSFLMITYIALFSTLLSRLSALACGSTRVTNFLYSMHFLNIHQSGVLTALAWLVPHETAAISAQVMCTPYNYASCHFMQSHIRKVYASSAVTCHLHFWQNDRDLLRATAVTRGGGTDTEIRVSTESQPWRRKFSRRSYRDLNPGPFSHESGALTTELSPSPSLVGLVCCVVEKFNII